MSRGRVCLGEGPGLSKSIIQSSLDAANAKCLRGAMGSSMVHNDPYLGRESVYHFDQMISAAMERSRAVAEWTHSNALTPLQKAASEILPHSFSLACAVRELVRSGYLFPAEVLIRPLLERAAVISYLAEVPELGCPVGEGLAHCRPYY